MNSSLLGELRPHAGRIGATIFKNEYAGVAEGLYWGISIEFDPLEHNDELLQCSASIDWMVLPVSDWRDLQGIVIEGGPATLDASFYIYEHNEASWTRIALSDRQGQNFSVTIDMTVELTDFVQQGVIPRDHIHVDITIPYMGLVIERAVVPGTPENRERAIDIARRYVDVRNYRDPELRFGVFEFDPKL